LKGQHKELVGLIIAELNSPNIDQVVFPGNSTSKRLRVWLDQIWVRGAEAINIILIWAIPRNPRLVHFDSSCIRIQPYESLKHKSLKLKKVI
jgi:hypothetical protein